MTRESRLNIVLGCATDYSARQILPFVASLRGTGYNGEIRLVIFEDQCDDVSGLAARFAVDLFPIARQPRLLPAVIARRLQNRGRMRWVHRSLSRVLPRACGRRAIPPWLGASLQHFLHIACSRYFVYYRILQERAALNSSVLLSDVRDVVFQSDPFRYCTGAKSLVFFLDPTVRLGDEPVNVEWMTTAYSEADCRRWQGARLACSGTTLGDGGSIVGYLHEMCMELIAVLPRIVGLHGVDQAVHNVLIWQGRFPDAVLCENGRHAVMTLKNATLDADRLDRNGFVSNCDGTPAPVLHQYDWHPALNAKWHVAD